MDFQDRVEKISATIQELHRVAPSGPKTRQLLDSLFRNIHSLKAVASANGFNELSRNAHEFENLLHSLRTGKVRLNEDVLRVFDDTVNTFSANIQGQPASINSSVTGSAFESVPSRDSSNLFDTLPDDIRTSLKEDERHRAAEAIREGSTLYVMEVAFELNDFDVRFKQLKEQLNDVGEIISTTARHTDKINFRVLYAAKAEKICVYEFFQQAVRAGESAAAALGKQIEFVVRGGDLLLDRSLCEALADPLLHLVRNAVDHGIETSGNIILEATISAGQARITVTDNGRGIDPADMDLLFQPGFSTAAKVSEFSGRGVGLDVVATAVNEVGGTITVTSEAGKGATFEIKLPIY